MRLDWWTVRAALATADSGRGGCLDQLGWVVLALLALGLVVRCVR